ncbi:MAG: cardiolipin synthase ClsB [Elusimicrobia bacterium]|nr:cardiolipin synthase ClsB [Elusimicrobiota bacterium]
MELKGLRDLLRRKPPGSGDLARDPALYEDGNRVTLLTDGAEIFRLMLEAIDSAQESVNLETYVFGDDLTGREFARRLAAKARAGVKVRLIVDSVGSLDTAPLLLGRLRNAGVRVLEYHPVAPWRPRWSWGKRDHRKILVVDGTVGFTGGVNIADAHLPVEKGGAGWRDCHVRVEGPAAFALERVFRSAWFLEGRRWFASPGHPDHKPGDAKVWVAANLEWLHRLRIRSAYLHVLRAARQEVIIANAYFIPDRGIRRALVAAARRGVKVRLLLPGRSDVAAVWYASRRRYEMLLRDGVEIYEWRGPMLHSKAAVVDRRWCSVGSYNLDHRSLMHNLEVNAHILDEGVAGHLAAVLEADIVRSREISLEVWRRRPALDRFFERLFYLFRYFF